MNVLEIKKSVGVLEKARTQNDVTTLRETLTQLKTGVKATEKLLRETKVGVAVNKLRGHEDSQVANLVKELVKNWKDSVSAEKRARKSESTGSSSNTTTTTTTKKEEVITSQVKDEQAIAKNITSSNSTKPLAPRTMTGDGVKPNIQDPSRSRSIGAIYGAVALETTLPSEEILKVCVDIEEAVFEKYQLTDNYRNQLRALIMGIKNKNNTQLRNNILNRSIKAEELAIMKSKDLAPPTLQKEFKQLHEKNLFDAQGAVEKRAVTDRFVCGKCKQREVSYYQMQTRSADEPLTTFCTCEKCGNRWKFC